MIQYLKATVWASGIYLVVPVALLSLGYFEMQSPEWDTNDSGAVQGFIFIFLASLSALACVAVAFPLIAKKLQPNFTTRKWVYLNILTVWLASFIASCVFWYYAGASDSPSIINHAVGLSLLLTVIGLVLLLPAMFTWLRVAKITHINLSQQDAASDATA
ncbi:hypothetical protein BTA51_28710 [Hahella sp. CCB-MM4]|uniref:hypothetical protein n=1 Tax=Hahella sp. (strain CCB-MM4) TaxID=1926491 RepID=UPI000B9BCADD|nr:hypothetical protein [Hahella sp. CCB-MM4]OZG69919.1 hypothetical protein BTA51_28710 [Hahella sp. CCB-MM4]